MNFTRTLFPLSMLLLSGCVVGPDYQKPETALPAKFSESKSASADNVTLNPWWESFRDKRLNDLVHQGMAENLSVLQALERITAAEANVVVAGAGALPSIGASAEASASGQDGDYLRLKNITLGYTLPKSVSRFVGMENGSLRVYISVDNVCTITGYSGVDPEVGNYGIDRGVYPVSRFFNFGVNINF